MSRCPVSLLVQRLRCNRRNGRDRKSADNDHADSYTASRSAANGVQCSANRHEYANSNSKAQSYPIADSDTQADTQTDTKAHAAGQAHADAEVRSGQRQSLVL